MIYLLTAIGLPPGGSCAHLHTNNTQNDTKQTKNNTHILRTTQNFGRVRAVPRLGKIYPGICLTTEEKAQKNLSQGS